MHLGCWGSGMMIMIMPGSVRIKMEEGKGYTQKTNGAAYIFVLRVVLTQRRLWCSKELANPIRWCQLAGVALNLRPPDLLESFCQTC
jgi:hypothetical protein